MRCVYEGKIFDFIGLHHTKTSCFAREKCITAGGKMY